MLEDHRDGIQGPFEDYGQRHATLKTASVQKCSWDVAGRCARGTLEFPQMFQ